MLPLNVSIAISVLVTTALLGLLYVPLKRRWEATTDAPADKAAAP